MEIDIVEIIDKNYVRISYEHGTFVGKWEDENAPQKGKYCVEIDYGKILNYEILKEANYYIKNINGKNVICGFIIEAGFNDGFVQFLDVIGDGIVGENIIKGDCIIMINIEENNLRKNFVSLEVDEIILYPVFN
jgi:hypothetical protein